MNKQTQLKILNVVVAAVFLSQALSGILRSFDLWPDGLWLLHTKGGYVLVAVIVLHLGYNWKWVVSQFFKKKPVVSKDSSPGKPGPAKA
jgi:hypothetical protein